MSYREQPPPPELTPWLACTWSRRAGGGAPVRVLPDGCIDVVWIEGRGTRVVGANTTAFLVALPDGTRAAGARLRPGAAPALLGVSAEALLDARVPLADAWGAAGADIAALLDEDAAGAVATLRAALLARAARAERPDALVAEAVARLHRPDVAVAGLADDLAISERQLRRRVTTAVGYGPKRLARVLRLRGALAAAAAGADLAGAALDAGYADQAHFAHDCRELAGVSASAMAVSSKTAAAGPGMMRGDER